MTLLATPNKLLDIGISWWFDSHILGTGIIVGKQELKLTEWDQSRRGPGFIVQEQETANKSYDIFEF